jgi:DNA-binding CsgD family transcriptional regulator
VSLTAVYIFGPRTKQMKRRSFKMLTSPITFIEFFERMRRKGAFAFGLFLCTLGLGVSAYAQQLAPQSNVKNPPHTLPILPHRPSFAAGLTQASPNAQEAATALTTTPQEIVLHNFVSPPHVLAEGDGIFANRKGLVAQQQNESDLLSKAIQQAASMDGGLSVSAGGMVLISRCSRPPLQVLVSPIRPSAVRLSQKIAVVVFINDPSRPQRRPEDTLLRTLYGLTRAECRVALLLSDGRAPKEIASKIGVTENTVRSQIKNIYNKTGVKRQSELVRLLLNHSSTQNQVSIY